VAARLVAEFLARGGMVTHCPPAYAVPIQLGGGAPPPPTASGAAPR
jgi:hypothetical protein